jgi:putative endonuclease
MVHRKSAAETGRIGENLACQELEARGYEVVECNWRCNEGEIDIVARHKGQWVFVEVKTRRSHNFGLPEDSVTRAKRRRLLNCGLTYLAVHELEDVPWRVDVVAIMLTNRDAEYNIQIHENAVYADGSE